jgi:hypothetical protein
VLTSNKGEGEYQYQGALPKVGDKTAAERLGAK